MNECYVCIYSYISINDYINLPFHLQSITQISVPYHHQHWVLSEFFIFAAFTGFRMLSHVFAWCFPRCEDLHASCPCSYLFIFLLVLFSSFWFIEEYIHSHLGFEFCFDYMHFIYIFSICGLFYHFICGRVSQSLQYWHFGSEYTLLWRLFCAL